MENGHAVDKSGSGLDLVYKFECDDGYWLKKGSGNTAYCNNKGDPVYPVCEKRRFYLVHCKGDQMLHIFKSDSTLLELALFYYHLPFNEAIVREETKCKRILS
jgi:hypothetical protein